MPTTTPRPLRVAVIEDQPDVRAIVKLLLERSGFVVQGEFETAEDALEQLSAAVDAIVLDNHLAGAMTGLEAAPHLKAVSPDAVVVLFSAMDLAPKAAVEPAIDAVLRKDRITQLPSTLRSLLSGRSR